MTASEIRQSFLDFFAEKSHTIVPSASILPQSPGLLFTNAGMNQFVPYFLGTEKAPFSPPRATDTQKCLRAGGKHNDLDDVGYDTYHHTLFEMLGNWSFGDYFKTEAINWAWELLVERWGFPPERLYATVYNPDKKAGDPSSFDQESYDIWSELFTKKGLDPTIHIVNGNVEDNFWKMGDTGPCGPCSELHLDLTPEGNTKGSLVNKDSDLCIELWNLVFIQYNAEPDGTYRDLPAKHVDTGMGFERAVNIIQGTKHFTDFSIKPTNYATDIFTPIFKKLEQLSGKTYQDIYPTSPDIDKSTLSTPMKEAIAFRVIADHIRTLSLSIADGILPGNTGRNYVLRRILRRAVNYGRTLGFTGETCFLPQIVDTLVTQFSTIFPEIKQRATNIKNTLTTEEKSFNKTLARGLDIFDKEIANNKQKLSGEFAFKLYDTFGFPIDLTEILCQQNNIGLDMEKFNSLMAEQKNRGDGGKEKTIVRALDISTNQNTEFVGFHTDTITTTITETHQEGDNLYIITEKSPFYVEMGGQKGDTGSANIANKTTPINKVIKIGNAIAHIINKTNAPDTTPGQTITLTINDQQRRSTEAHHTATHLLHWALHQTISEDATQQGSLVAPDKLRFDFSSAALTPAQIQTLQDKVNTAITENTTVSAKEVPHKDIKNRKDITQFFGDKYGETVRVVQIGGQPQALNGYSMELCGGAHVNNTSEIGTFIIKSESAIASGVRRIEAACGQAAKEYTKEKCQELKNEIKEAQTKLNSANQKLSELNINPSPFTPPSDTAESITKLETTLQETKQAATNADKTLKKAQTAAAAQIADQALVQLLDQGNNIVALFEGPASLLQELLNGCKKKQFTKAALFIVDDGDKLHLGAISGSDGQAAGHNAGKIIQSLTTIAGGKGGGKPDMARGAAPQRNKAQEILTTAKSQLNT